MKFITSNTLCVLNEVKKVVWPGLCCYLHRVFVTGVGASRSFALSQLFTPPTPPHPNPRHFLCRQLAPLGHFRLSQRCC